MKSSSLSIRLEKMPRSGQHFPWFRGTCSHGGNEKLLSLYVKKPFDMFDTRTLPIVSPTTRQCDRQWEVKVLKEVLKIVLSLNSSKEINLVTAYIRVFFSMLLIVMRPVDKPSDWVTLIMATGGEEVRITARLQCPIDLSEARKFRKAYSRLCISILTLRTWSQNKNNVRTNFVILYGRYRCPQLSSFTS